MSKIALDRYSVDREALVERARLLDLVDQRLRHRLAGLVVERELRSTSGVASQCSLSCDGNSTKSRGTFVPASDG